MLNLTLWWCGEGEEKQTLCNFNSYKFNKYFLLSYLTSMPNTELYIPAEISCIVWFNKNRGQVKSKTRKLCDFHGGKSISKANWYSSFSSFCILIFTRFFYCTVPAASLFNVLQHLLIDSCHFLLETSCLSQQLAQVSGMSSRGRFHHPCLLTSELY